MNYHMESLFELFPRNDSLDVRIDLPESFPTLQKYQIKHLSLSVVEKT